MPRISYAQTGNEVETIPNTTEVLRTLHTNLRSGVWNPPEIVNWGTVISSSYGYYQLVGNICFLVLNLNVTTCSIGAANTDLTLPVPAMRNTGAAGYTRFATSYQIYIEDKTAVANAGACIPSDTSSSVLLVPTYAPAAPARNLTLSGWYWTE